MAMVSATDVERMVNQAGVRAEANMNQKMSDLKDELTKAFNQQLEQHMAATNTVRDSAQNIADVLGTKIAEHEKNIAENDAKVQKQMSDIDKLFKERQAEIHSHTKQMAEVDRLFKERHTEMQRYSETLRVIDEKTTLHENLMKSVDEAFREKMDQMSENVASTGETIERR